MRPGWLGWLGREVEVGVAGSVRWGLATVSPECPAARGAIARLGEAGCLMS